MEIYIYIYFIWYTPKIDKSIIYCVCIHMYIHIWCTHGVGWGGGWHEGLLARRFFSYILATRKIVTQQRFSDNILWIWAANCLELLPVSICEYVYIYIHIHTYITLHLKKIALHCIALHYIALHCITLHYIALHTYIHLSIFISIFTFILMIISMFIYNSMYTHIHVYTDIYTNT